MKTLSYSGRDLLLPLAGDTRIAFQETGLTGLVFADEEAVRSLIEFEDELQITDVDGSRTLRGTKPGAGYWRADLERLDYLLGYRLTSAVARHDVSPATMRADHFPGVTRFGELIRKQAQKMSLSVSD
ncbi:hypothetical protein FYZ48_17345 [Gimesia chilikensis]|uniref:hypothetical protein n=1 Tax=Gimesia chilikensis TaxID=2605989 RepID=UPI0011ED4191|nr:hypothetical protein [Gimesia chilikensis]KAA0135894.1 hypothetical protein FYZ48_17345 [Gimesia chilikensis]